MSSYPQLRMRRKRQADWSRRLVAETHLSVNGLIWTAVITDGITEAVPSLPGVNRLSLEDVVSQAKELANLGVPALALFPHIDPKTKSEDAREALNPDGLVPRAVRALKAEVPNIGVIVDVALDPYTSHGHDGVMEGETIVNDATVSLLAESAIVLAEAGADIVAPSDMMDGRVGAVRDALESHNFQDVMIMSYAAKYASGFYGPYRDAIGTSTALKGDKRTYQMDPANSDEALHEVALDLIEGADMVMVKPGMPYLDIIRRIKDEYAVPTYAFQVSGEYAMIMAAAQNGWLDEKRVIMESLMSFKRAGCDGVLSYFTPKVARWLAEAR
ncbi:porphobilinogen synthase [Litorimonas sp. RW-G-Af-16]|uniref:porphobilinogen synthase n=1 Tax=Litorimonas sp. RW-G-Af-16 TaxID=3241168 RepID=UPI00390C5144